MVIAGSRSLDIVHIKRFTECWFHFKVFLQPFDIVFMMFLQPTSSEKSLAIDLLVPSKMLNSTSTGSRDLHIQTKAKYQKDEREELFGSRNSSTFFTSSDY